MLRLINPRTRPHMLRNWSVRGICRCHYISRHPAWRASAPEKTQCIGLRPILRKWRR